MIVYPTIRRGRCVSQPGLETPLAVLVVTYVLAAMFLFFAMNGSLPGSGTAGGSLERTSSSTDTLLGQVYQVVMWGTVLPLLVKASRAILLTGRQLSAISALSLLAPVSSLWSQLPSNSLRRGIFLCLTTAFAFFLVRSFSPHRLAELLVITGVIAGLLGIAVSLLLPSIGRDLRNGGAWQGVFRAKNACAQVMLFLLTPAVSFRFRSVFMQGMRYALFPLAGILIVMSYAKTAWVLTPGYFLFIMLASWTRKLPRKDALLVLFFLVITVALLAIGIPFVLPWLLNALGKDSSVSGRLPLWTSAVVSLMKKPLLGYGYEAFWTGLTGESLNIYMSTHFEIYQAQNGFLEVGLQLGLVGLGLLLLTLIKAFKDALLCFRYGHSNAVNWYVGLVLLSVIYNLDETFFASSCSLPWLFYVIACAGLATEAARVRSRSSARSRLQPTSLTREMPFLGAPALAPQVGGA